MKIFRSYTYKWWQLAIFKVSLMVFGMSVGIYWHDLLNPFLTALIVIWFISTLYIMFISFKN